MVQRCLVASLRLLGEIINFDIIFTSAETTNYISYNYDESFVDSNGTYLVYGQLIAT